MWDRSLDEARNTWHTLRYRHPMLATLAFESLKGSHPVVAGDYAQLGDGVNKDTINLVAASAHIRHVLYTINYMEEWLIRHTQDAASDTGMRDRSVVIANALKRAGLDVHIESLPPGTNHATVSNWVGRVWQAIGDAGIDLGRLQAVEVSSMADTEHKRVAIEVEQIIDDAARARGRPFIPTDSNGRILEQTDPVLLQALEATLSQGQAGILTMPSGIRDAYGEALQESVLYGRNDGKTAQQMRDRVGLLRTGFPPKEELECNRAISGNAQSELRAILEAFWRELGGEGYDGSTGSNPNGTPNNPNLSGPHGTGKQSPQRF